jgi:hypothetical protein
MLVLYYVTSTTIFYQRLSKPDYHVDGLPHSEESVPHLEEVKNALHVSLVHLQLMGIDGRGSVTEERPQLFRTPGVHQSNIREIDDDLRLVRSDKHPSP